MPTGGFGTFITDAFGKLHDISKGAFDSYSIKHEGKFDPGFSTLMDEGFTAAAKDVLSRAGFRSDMLDKFGTTTWMDTVVEILEDVTIDLGAVAVAVGTETGPVGAAVALAVSAGAPIMKAYWANIKDSFQKIPPQDAYKGGQWVSIDNGKTAAVRGIHNVLDDIFNRRRRMGALGESDPVRPLIEGLEDEIAAEENYSTGFYLGGGDQPDTIQVYNFFKSREETKNVRDIRPLAQAEATTLDNDPVWSEIRLLKFETRQEQLLGSNVNTDPGAEVVWKGQKYLVINASGRQIQIEHKLTGAQHLVQLSELEGGKRSHNNSWNYENRAPEGFASASKAEVSQGDFVWIPPLPAIKSENPFCTRQLACIQMLEGEAWQGFTAIDGTFCTFQLSDQEVRGVSDELNAMFSASHIFNNFRDAVVRGHDVARMACGKHEAGVLVSLGVSPLESERHETEKIIKPWKERATSWLEGEKERFMQNKTLNFQGDGGLRQDLDNAELLAIEGIGTKSGLVNQITSEDYWPTPGSQKQGGGGIALAIGIGGAAAFLLR